MFELQIFDSRGEVIWKEEGSTEQEVRTKLLSAPANLQAEFWWLTKQGPNGREHVDIGDM